jgi:hypothetical protein
MPPLRLGVSLQPRWPLDDGTAALRAAGHAEARVTGFTPSLMKGPGKGCLFPEPISPG